LHDELPDKKSEGSGTVNDLLTAPDEFVHGVSKQQSCHSYSVIYDL